MKTNSIILVLCIALSFMVSCTKEKNTPEEQIPTNTQPANPGESGNNYQAKGIIQFINNTKYFVEVSSSTYTIACILGAYDQQTIQMKDNWYVKTTISATYYDPKDEDNPVAGYVLTHTFEKGKDYRILLKDNMISYEEITE